MLRTLLIILFITSIFRADAMEQALCKIPTAVEAFYALNGSSISECTLSTLSTDVYALGPLLIGTLGVTGACLLYECLRYPTEQLQNYRRRSDTLILIPFLLRKGGNPFKCVEVEDHQLINDATLNNAQEDEEQVTLCAAIHRAAHSANLDLLKLYLKHKSSEDDIDIKNNFGETALLLACCTQAITTRKCIALLIKHGACLQATNYRGLSALHYAAYNRCQDALTTLLKEGADVHATDFKGNTPLHYAARASFSNGCILLFQYGAFPDVLNHEKKTPLQSTFVMIAPEILRCAHTQRQAILSPENPCLNAALPKEINIMHRLMMRELGLK